VIREQSIFGEKDPLFVGVPVIAPEVEFIESPSGNEPDTTLQGPGVFVKSGVAEKVSP
jgi:hypothetical protein